MLNAVDRIAFRMTIDATIDEQRKDLDIWTKCSVSSGLYGMLLFALVAVFVAGHMVGRTPESIFFSPV